MLSSMMSFLRSSIAFSDAIPALSSFKVPVEAGKTKQKQKTENIHISETVLRVKHHCVSHFFNYQETKVLSVHSTCDDKGIYNI